MGWQKYKRTPGSVADVSQVGVRVVLGIFKNQAESDPRASELRWRIRVEVSLVSEGKDFNLGHDSNRSRPNAGKLSLGKDKSAIYIYIYYTFTQLCFSL